MDGLFSRKPRTSPRTDIVFGMLAAAMAALGLLRDDSFNGDNHLFLILAYCLLGICGVCYFVRGLLRMRNWVSQSDPSDASENPSENILQDPEFPSNEATDE